jgi:hypothetical protein
MAPLVRRSLAPLFLATALVVASKARAQSAIDEGREAFARGIAAEEGGRAADACKEFRRSLSLVRELGPMRKVAQCDANDRRVLSAAALLEEIASRLPVEDPERAAVDAELTAVRARAAKLVIRPAADTPAGARVRLDGRDVTAGPDPVAVDPGSHELVVTAPGTDPELVTVEIAEGESKTVDLPTPTAREAPAPAPTPPPPRPRERPSDLSLPGFLIGAVGVSGVVVAAVSGGKLLSDHSEFEDCKARASCDPEPLADAADPLLIANAIGWGVAAVGLGVGASLVVVDAVQDARFEAEVGPTSASLRVRF